jgi:hypothetical protein
MIGGGASDNELSQLIDLNEDDIIGGYILDEQVPINTKIEMSVEQHKRSDL